MVKCGVFFAVRTEFLSVVHISFGLQQVNEPCGHQRGAKVTALQETNAELFFSVIKSGAMNEKV
jgi:hypothetical protein